ncbi:hypothetical protein PRNP1_004677 [Phytophthora ramorum]
MNGTQEAPAGAPLAAHFEAKRRILATVKQMEQRGEKLEEATPEEVLEAASKAEQTVFKFDFSLSESDAKKRSRNRKRKKRRAKKPQGEAEKSEDATTGRPTPAPQQGNAKAEETMAGASFLKLRKPTGTESEVAKMHLRYGQGRRNLAAMKQREQRKKTADAQEGAEASSEFKFNFVASSKSAC